MGGRRCKEQAGAGEDLTTASGLNQITFGVPSCVPVLEEPRPLPSMFSDRNESIPKSLSTTLLVSGTSVETHRPCSQRRGLALWPARHRAELVLAGGRPPALHLPARPARSLRCAVPQPWPRLQRRGLHTRCGGQPGPGTEGGGSRPPAGQGSSVIVTGVSYVHVYHLALCGGGSTVPALKTEDEPLKDATKQQARMM